MPMIIVIVMVLPPFFTHLYQIWSAFSSDGGNEQLAYLSGINVDRLKIMNYTLSGRLLARHLLV